MTIDELIASEPNVMVFKSLHAMAPQYMCNLFAKTSLQQLTEDYQRRTLRTDKMFFIWRCLVMEWPHS